MTSHRRALSDARWRALTRHDDSSRLTADEMRDGWHFCPEWDSMLLNLNDTEGEMESCPCTPWTEDEIANALRDT